MDAPLCEVIGCGTHAAWQLIAEGQPDREEYLCETHWNYLRARVPDYSPCYVPLGQEPPETAVVSVAGQNHHDTPV
ncbi:MAG TPA: hypothetical protein VKU00_10695 [Chthonomonadaceae bacterium]|nr:hypothetical protein [Chthonomonadaceae bacterium]